MCNICGQPDYLRCNCQSSQPFCDQCAEDVRCNEKMDADCVIYHLNSQQPSRLTCLGLGNGASVRQIVEKIDEFICNSFNIPFEPVNTESIVWTAGGPAGHKPQADVLISPDSDNIFTIRENGVYVFNDHKVKVDEDDTPDYLENQIVGSDNPSGNGLSIDVVNNNGQLVIVPYLDVEELFGLGFDIRDTNTVDLSYVPGLPGVLSADVKVSAEPGNIILKFYDGIYASGDGASSVTDAINGLTLVSGDVKLGGALIENTVISDTDYNLQIDNNILLLGNLNSLGYTQPAGYAAGENTRLQVFHKTDIRGGASSVSRFYNAHVLDDDTLADVNTHQYIGQIVNTFFHYADTATYGTDTQDAALGCFLSISSTNSSAVQAPNSIAAILAGVYFDNPNVFGETSGSPGTLDNSAIFKTQVPSYQPGMTSGNTPVVTNLYSLFLSDLASGSAASKFTNRFGIYQEGTTDINRFFGPVQNAASLTQFTSDERVKENIQSYNDGLDIIDAINVKSFNFTYAKDRNVVGVIAQELEQILPDSVSQTSFRTPEGEDFEDFRIVDQNRLFYTLLNAVKELSAKVKLLESKY